MSRTKSRIHVDDPQSWPPEIYEAVLANASRLAKHQFADRSVALEDGGGPSIGPWIEGRQIVAYHGTRLLPHERELIASEGLRPSSPEALHTKLSTAALHYPAILTPGAVATMIAESAVNARGHEARTGQVCFVANLGAFTYEPRGLHPFLTHWGGEMVYFHAESTHQQIDELERISAPAIVEIVVPFDEIPSYCQDRIGKGMVAKMAGVQYVAEGHFRPTNSAKVNRVVGPTDPDWPLSDLHPGARKW